MKFICVLFVIACCSTAQVRVAAIAHRGEHLHHPENTLPAYEAAIDAGADFIEVDVRTTSDHKLVMMHDRTVDSTTNGKGPVKDMTLAEIRALDAGGSRVPTFDEVLQLAQGRISIYVDSKDIAPADMVAAVEKYGMQDKIVVYGGYQYLKNVAALRPKIKIMPEAVSALLCKKTINDLHPPVIAFDARDFTDEIIAVAKSAGAQIYVDRFGSSDNPAGWQDAIDRGATGIQTNKPAELVDYLRAHRYHN
ncbi:MAG: glycerophosphodiester phosphodiesterase family protein [Acidobacteriota bacterium]|nr:glycerophosphodiester phosphodiesterase family protein [Acidobacteriota bacterium]